MKHSDFHVGLKFFGPTGEWQCTDVGTRTIVAIRIEGRLPASWYKGPPYAVQEVLFNEEAMATCYTSLRDALQERIEDDSHPGYGHEHVRRMMAAKVALRQRKRKYPSERQAVFKIDRIGPNGELLHPFGVKRRSGYWAIEYFEPFTERYGEMPENEFVKLRRATKKAVGARAKGHKS